MAGLRTPPFPDSPHYTQLSFLGHAPYPWTVPLLYRIFPTDSLRMAAQVSLAACSWWFLAVAASRLVADRRVRTGLRLVLLALGLVTPVASWNSTILSESAAISLTAALIGCWLCHVARPTWRTATGVVVVTLMWSFTRPDLAFLAAAVSVVTLAVVAVRARTAVNAALAAGLVLVSAYGLAVDDRNTSVSSSEIAQVLEDRILANPSWTDWFIAHGMPYSPAVAKASGGIYGIALQQLPYFETWLKSSGTRTYAEFMVTHPVYTLWYPLPDFSGELASLNWHPVSAYEATDPNPTPSMLSPDVEYGRSRQVLPSVVQDLLFQQGQIGEVLLLAAGALALAFVARRRFGRDARMWVPLVVVVSVVPQGYVVWLLGGNSGLGRKAMVPAVMLRVGLWTIAAFALDRLLRMRAAAAESAGPLAPVSTSSPGTLGREGSRMIVSGAPATSAGARPTGSDKLAAVALRRPWEAVGAAGRRGGAVGAVGRRVGSVGRRVGAVGRRVGSWDGTGAVIGATVTLLALVLALYPLTRHDALFGVQSSTGVGYDDGVYLGATMRFVNGVLPYRDFVFTQPPGLLLLLSPIGLFGRAVGTESALALARLATAAVCGLNALLTVVALRRRGRLAMAIGGTALAVYPLTVAAGHTLLLEPYLVCGCLVGTVLAFSRPDPSTARLIGAGAAVGLASAVKLWGVVVVLALVVALLPDWRRVRAAVGGALAGFVVPCLVFFAASPTGFWRDVVWAQLNRQDVLDRLSIAQRLVMITGIGGISNLSRTGTAVVLVVALAAATLAVFIADRGGMTRLEVFAAVAAVLSIVELCVSRAFYDHYAYFAAPFLAIVLGSVAARLHRHAVAYDARHALSQLRYVTAGALVGALIAVAVYGIPARLRYAGNYVAGAYDPSAAVSSAVATGACTVSDDPVLLLVANRFTPSESGCPGLVDPFGTFIVDDSGHPPPGVSPFPRGFVTTWRQALSSAAAVVLSVPESDYVPWTGSLLSLFSRRFRFASEGPHAYVYLSSSSHRR